MPERPDRPVRLSLVDRLVDEDPRAREDPPRSWSDSAHRFKVSFLRDLEWLLNTRCTIGDPPEDFPELRESLYRYGLPDVTSMSGDAPGVRRQLLRQVEERIRLFEPRLSGVRVSEPEEEDGKSKRIRFVLEGILRMDPEPERVAFDTVLEISSGRFLVSGDGDA